jgi:hypothetical protein
VLLCFREKVQNVLMDSVLLAESWRIETLAGLGRGNSRKELPDRETGPGKMEISIK